MQFISLTPFYMEDLEKEVSTVADTTVTPTEEEKENPPESELTDDEVKSEVERLKEEAKTTEDPKEKRHLEQQAGRLQQLFNAREKANLAEQTLRDKEDRIKQLEEKEIEIIFAKTQTDDGLAFFEDLYKTDKAMAEKVAKEKFQSTAKTLIDNARKQLAEQGNEDAKKKISEDDIRASVIHEIAVKQVSKTFSDLSEEEKATAQKYFDRIAGKGHLSIEEAEEFADMAKHYATRGRKIDPVEKEKILAKNAATIGGGTKIEKGADSPESLKQKYIDMGYDERRATLMAQQTL